MSALPISITQHNITENFSLFISYNRSNRLIVGIVYMTSHYYNSCNQPIHYLYIEDPYYYFVVWHTVMIVRDQTFVRRKHSSCEARPCFVRPRFAQPLIRKAKAKKQKKKYERFYVHDQPFCKLKNRDGTTVADLVLYHQSDERELFYRLYSTLEWPLKEIWTLMDSPLYHSW
jgi:hypothetical protein